MLKSLTPKQQPKHAYEFNVYPGIRDVPVMPDVKGYVVEDDRKYFRVLVYSNANWLRQGYHWWSGNTRGTNGLKGAVIPFTVYNVPQEGHPKLRDIIGIVTLAKTKMYHDILSHEALHMATTFLRSKRRCLKLGKEICHREEILAYTLDNCYSQLLGGIHGK